MTGLATARRADLEGHGRVVRTIGGVLGRDLSPEGGAGLGGVLELSTRSETRRRKPSATASASRRRSGQAPRATEQRFADAPWNVTANVWHVADNLSIWALSIWAERLAEMALGGQVLGGQVLGGQVLGVPCDQDELARARRYESSHCAPESGP